ncbi:MAG: hypothetical protein Q8S54_15980 [Bacteroidota bacterium]|nr:hypothetical protein [Odoribacter sp.]MDP3644670.1 hypothetical protein [Bacteroidota bacterium]
MKQICKQKNSSLTFLIFFLFSISVDLAGQTNTANPYSQLLFPEFAKSTIMMKSGDTSSALLNYNTVDEEMIFDQQGIFRIVEHTEDIDTIYLHGGKFVPVGKAFYEVLVTGRISVYIQHKSRFTTKGTATAYGLTSQTNAPTRVTTVRAGNQVRNLELPDNVIVSPATVYWVKVKDEMHKFTTERQFLKIFPDYESPIKEFIKTNKLDLKISENLKKLGNYCNGLIR